MKAFAHLSPTVPAIFVAAMGIALSVFLLPGAWVQGEPSPLVAVVGGAAGRVAADLPATVDKRASQPAREAASSAGVASTPSKHFAPRRQQVATNAHRVQRHARTGVVGQAPSAPQQAAAAAASATPVTTSGSLSGPTTAPGEDRGHRHGHGHGLKSPVGAPAPGLHGHGNGFGRSSEHHHGPRRGHAKQAPTAPLPAPTAPPKVHGGGNGHKGGKK
jgi:hypothetical protein